MSTPVRTEPTPHSRSGRIRFVDALRGVAALAVVLHHYNLRLHWGLLEFGNLGVPAFFVLSGFVVTMSVGDAAVNATFIGRFALRRVLRLDPPYWATMALVIGMAMPSPVKHQAAFQAIADANGGTRAAGIPGYDASLEYVVDTMMAAGYNVTLNAFPFTFVPPAVLRQTAPSRPPTKPAASWAPAPGTSLRVSPLSTSISYCRVPIPAGAKLPTLPASRPATSP